jgi:hypothetical protein
MHVMSVEYSNVMIGNIISENLALSAQPFCCAIRQHDEYRLRLARPQMSSRSCMPPARLAGSSAAPGEWPT